MLMCEYNHLYTLPCVMYKRIPGDLLHISEKTCIDRHVLIEVIYVMFLCHIIIPPCAIGIHVYLLYTYIDSMHCLITLKICIMPYRVYAKYHRFSCMLHLSHSCRRYITWLLYQQVLSMFAPTTRKIVLLGLLFEDETFIFGGMAPHCNFSSGTWHLIGFNASVLSSVDTCLGKKVAWQKAFIVPPSRNDKPFSFLRA